MLIIFLIFALIILLNATFLQSLNIFIFYFIIFIIFIDIFTFLHNIENIEIHFKLLPISIENLHRRIIY
jgi:hypothetical protein